MPKKKDQSLTALKAFLFSYYATNTILISFLGIFLRSKGLSGTEIGWVLAIGPLATIFSQPFWGYMSDKYKTVKWMIVICISGLIISSMFFLQSETLVYILIFGSVFYFFTAPVSALGDSLGQRRAEDLGISFGTVRNWGSIGFAVSSLCVGTFLTVFGVEYMVWPYIVLAGIALIFALRLTDVEASEQPVHLQDIKKLIQNKPFLLFLLFFMFITISHRANDSFIGLYIENLGGSEQLVGVAWFVGVMSEAVVFSLGAYWFRKYHSIVFVIIAGALYTVRWLLFAEATTPTAVIVLQLLHGVTFAVLYLASFDYISKLIPKILQSTGHLIFYSVFFGVSGIIGSLAGGWILEVLGGHALYVSMAISSGIGTVLLTMYHMTTTKRRRFVKS